MSIAFTAARRLRSTFPDEPGKRLEDYFASSGTRGARAPQELPSVIQASPRVSRAAAGMMMAGVMATLLVGNLLSSLSPMYIGALMENMHFTKPTPAS